MSKTPVVYKSTHRVKFSDLDPYNHVRAAFILETHWDPGDTELSW